jgi:hypothetical protein
MAGATAVIERLLEDDYVHEQLAAGSTRARAAYRRARAIRAQEAVQDKKLYDHVRATTSALSEAARRALGKPEPEPPKRWRRVPVLLVGVGVFALVRTMHRAEQQNATAGAPAPPAPAPR